jgi:hypothetical protein
MLPDNYLLLATSYPKSKLNRVKINRVPEGIQIVTTTTTTNKKTNKTKQKTTPNNSKNKNSHSLVFFPFQS